MTSQPQPDDDTERHANEQLNELLDICQDFIARAGQTTRDELDAALRARGNNGGRGWLIDMLQLQLHRRTTYPNN